MRINFVTICTRKPMTKTGRSRYRSRIIILIKIDLFSQLDRMSRLFWKATIKDLDYQLANENF